MKKFGFSLVQLLVVVTIVSMLSVLCQAAEVTSPTTFRDRVMFRGSTGPDFDADNKFSIGGTKVTKTAAEINALNAGASITGNIPVASITNAAGTVGASIGGNIPVAAITNAAGSVGGSIGGNIPVAAVTNAAGTLGASIGGNIPVASITNAAGTLGSSIGGNIAKSALTNAIDDLIQSGTSTNMQTISFTPAFSSTPIVSGMYLGAVATNDAGQYPVIYIDSVSVSQVRFGSTVMQTNPIYWTAVNVP
jgi:hypothetical protein